MLEKIGLEIIRTISDFCSLGEKKVRETHKNIVRLVKWMVNLNLRVAPDSNKNAENNKATLDNRTTTTVSGAIATDINEKGGISIPIHID